MVGQKKLAGPIWLPLWIYNPNSLKPLKIESSEVLDHNPPLALPHAVKLIF
jgi:hypothetical protein